jgi:molybdopterin-binding protein
MKVVVDVGFDIVALVTHQALTDMQLSPGVEVSVVFKAAAVHLIPRTV